MVTPWPVASMVYVGQGSPLGCVMCLSVSFIVESYQLPENSGFKEKGASKQLAFISSVTRNYVDPFS